MKTGGRKKNHNECAPIVAEWKRIRKTWLRALEQDDPGAFYRLGVYYLKEFSRRNVCCQTLWHRGTSHRPEPDIRMAHACLKKAMELGSEDGFLLYHRLFSRGKKVIEDDSYAQMVREYRICQAADRSAGAEQRDHGAYGYKERLKRYLALGTKAQKRKSEKKAQKRKSEEKSQKQKSRS
ncbi:MAG: hypothetical protein LUD16_12115 [Lachnospiraceae bacterium]|nr:hypothetical protein [Lachnospiraceae bacterium]